MHHPHPLDKKLNREIMNRVADKCYLPANEMFRKRIEASHGRFRMSLSLTGIVIDQFRKFRPDALESFKELVATGGLELLAETYHHSLAFLYSEAESQR